MLPHEPLTRDDVELILVLLTNHYNLCRIEYLNQKSKGSPAQKEDLERIYREQMERIESAKRGITALTKKLVE